MCAVGEALQRDEWVFARDVLLLPARIYVAGMREWRPDLLVNDALIIGLDRGNAPASWGDFFRERWPRLTPQECEATQRWILWLSEFDPPPIEDASLSRAYDTMDLLAHQTGATPIAAWSRK
jgi:hypothetical protein